MKSLRKLGDVESLAATFKDTLHAQYGSSGPEWQPGAILVDTEADQGKPHSLLDEPWVRDIYPPDGGLVKIDPWITHIIKDGHVHEVQVEENDTSFHLAQDVTGTPEVSLEGTSDMERAFLLTAAIRERLNEFAYALGQVGCTHVYRAWRARESTVRGTEMETLKVSVFLAVYGGAPNE